MCLPSLHYLILRRTFGVGCDVKAAGNFAPALHLFVRLWPGNIVASALIMYHTYDIIL